jgi:RNA polymerase sigma-70 factor, ECF subfamily
MSAQADLTGLLNAWSGGDQAAGDRLLALIYRELRMISAQRLSSHAGPLTLQATELINEAYLRLARQNENSWANRNHFFAIAATVMRRVLLDHARRRHSQRRDRRMESDTDPEGLAMSESRAQELLDLDEALTQLAAMSERQAQVIEMRYFGGMTVEEVAEALEISTATVKRDWTIARAWLARQLHDHDLP